MLLILRKCDVYVLFFYTLKHETALKQPTLANYVDIVMLLKLGASLINNTRNLCKLCGHWHGIET